MLQFFAIFYAPLTVPTHLPAIDDAINLPAVDDEAI